MAAKQLKSKSKARRAKSTQPDEVVAVPPLEPTETTEESEASSAKPKKLMSAVRFEVVRPIEITIVDGVKHISDGDWNEFGRILRSLQTPLYRIMNKAITNLAIASHLHKCEGDAFDAAKTHWRGKAYSEIRDFWREELEFAARRGDTLVDANLRPSGYLIDGLQRKVNALNQRFQKEKGKISLPTIRREFPLCIRDRGVKVEVIDGEVVLSVKLLEDRWSSMIVKPYKSLGYVQLQYILANPDKVGDGRLLKLGDRNSYKKKWNALLSFERSPPATKSGRTMAIHRGVTNFLTYTVANADNARPKFGQAPGDAILAFKAQMNARRRALQSVNNQLGSGARGHGKTRRYERLDRLSEKEANWVETYCQQTAARVLAFAKEHGVGTILLESWGNPAADTARDDDQVNDHVEYLIRSMPMAKLRDLIARAAVKAGVEVKIVDAAYNSRDCPKCGHRHAEAPVISGFGNKKLFLCSSCGLEYNVDYIATWNMLIREGHSSPVDEGIALRRDTAKKKEEFLSSVGRKTRRPTNMTV